MIAGGTTSWQKVTWQNVPGGILVDSVPRFRFWQGRKDDESRVEMEPLPAELTSRSLREFPIRFFMRRDDGARPRRAIVPLPDGWDRGSLPHNWDESAGRRRKAPISAREVAPDQSATDHEPDPQVKAHNSIVATVTGQLSTTWDSGKLFYASVKAGGTEIELDPAACPKVTRELLEFSNTQGGGLVSDIQVEAKGYLVFEKRPQTLRRREISRDDIDAVVPVLRVQTIKITTLPLGKDIGPTKRDRDAVKSTTVRTFDAEMPNQ